MFANHGQIVTKACACDPRSVSDFQMMFSDLVTNYKKMTTRMCKGVPNQTTVKLRTLINYGTLVLHKCTCSSKLINITDLINYGTIVNCLTTCSLGEPNKLTTATSEESAINIANETNMPTILETTEFTNEENSEAIERRASPTNPRKKKTVEQYVPFQGYANQTEYPTDMCRQCYNQYTKIMENPAYPTVAPQNGRINKKHRCPKCFACLRSLRKARVHLETCDQTPKPFECPACPFKATNKGSLNGHKAKCFYINTAEHLAASCRAKQHTRE